MFEQIGYGRLIVLAIIVVIAVASLIYRKKNGGLPKLEREIKNFPFILTALAVVTFFLILSVPHLYVPSASLTEKIETVEDTEQAIHEIRRDMRDLARDLSDFNSALNIFFILLLTTLGSAYSIGRLLVEKSADKKPILGLNDE